MIANEDDYYGILGVSCECNNKQLKSAFRKLAMQYHPDHNPHNKQAEQKFRKICEAYEVLKDPQKRALYNQFYHETFKDNDTTFESSISQENNSKKTGISKFAAYSPTIFLIVLIIVLSVLKTPPELLPFISIHCLFYMSLRFWGFLKALLITIIALVIAFIFSSLSVISTMTIIFFYAALNFYGVKKLKELGIVEE